MYPYLESIKVINRQYVGIERHNERMNRTLAAIYGADPIKIEDLVEIPTNLEDGVYKCRILYRNSIESVEFQAYKPRLIKSLKVVHSSSIDYHFKSSDRRSLDELFALRAECDDILIVKNGLVTDTSYSNIVFFDGSEWITPLEPLLRGTQRQKMINLGMIRERQIKLEDLASFVYAKPINAMLDFEETCSIEIKNIY